MQEAEGAELGKMLWRGKRLEKEVQVMVRVLRIADFVILNKFWSFNRTGFQV
jgi:hypothetical protein